MNRLGITFIVLGFGSAALAATHAHYQFILLSWADPMQPWLGILLGIAGVVLLGRRIAESRRRQAARAVQAGPSPYGLQAPAGQVDPYGARGPQPYLNGIQQPGSPTQAPQTAYPAPYGNVSAHNPTSYGAAAPRTDYSDPADTPR